MIQTALVPDRELSQKPERLGSWPGRVLTEPGHRALVKPSTKPSSATFPMSSLEPVTSPSELQILLHPQRGQECPAISSYSPINNCLLLRNMHGHIMCSPLPRFISQLGLASSSPKQWLLSLPSVVSGVIFGCYIWDRSDIGIWKVPLRTGTGKLHAEVT